MAIIRLDCNLNGGDSVTPNNELFYRIYGDVDSYTTPIWTTGTALSDANVTVDDDRVIITGVDGTTNNIFKIAAVDAAFNEGELSDASSIAAYKIKVDLTETQFAQTVATIPELSGVIKIETKINRMPTVNANYVFRLGSNQFKFGNSSGSFLIGTGAGFDLYPMADLEGADLVITYDQAAGHDTSLSWNGNDVTLGSTAGTKPTVTSGVAKIGDGTTDYIEVEYLRLYDDTTLVAEWKINEGSGLVLLDETANGYDMNIEVGTGTIGDMWVAL